MSTPATAPQRGLNSERDLVFCHECNEEWYRDEHGLTCFACGSDFCEIVSSSVTFPEGANFRSPPHNDSPKVNRKS